MTVICITKPITDLYCWMLQC